MKRLIVIPLFIIIMIGSLNAYVPADTPRSSKKIMPVSVGDGLPHYELTDTQYQSVDLYSYLAEQPIILIYYRGGW